MPSPREPQRTLARRVAVLSALAAGLASVLTLAVAMTFAERFATDDAEAAVREQLRQLVREVDEEIADHHPSDERLRAELDDELDDANDRGFEVAIARRGELFAGDGSLFEERVADGPPCGFVPGARGGWFRCVDVLPELPEWEVTVALPAPRHARLTRSLVAGGITALAIAVLLAAIAGFVAMRISLAPLRRMRDAMDARRLLALDEDAPLPARSGLEELDSLQAALEDVLARLRHELGRSRRFAAAAAHELRTPLARILAESELLLEERDHGLHEPLGRIHRTARQMQVLTDRLLLLATPGERFTRTGAVSLTALAEELVAELPEAERSRVRIEATTDGVVGGDPTLLRVALSNAIENALRHADRQVEIRIEPHGAGTRVEVCDDGAGIAAERREEVFRDFERFGATTSHRPSGVDGNERKRGYGLGLALVRHVVLAYGGQAHFEEPRVKGARLVLELPAVDAGSAAVQVHGAR